MSTSNRPRHTYGPNKENILPKIKSPQIKPTVRQRRRRQTTVTPFSADTDTENEEQRQQHEGIGEHGENGDDDGEIWNHAVRKKKLGEDKRRGVSGKFEVLRDVTGKFANKDLAGAGSGSVEEVKEDDEEEEETHGFREEEGDPDESPVSELEEEVQEVGEIMTHRVFGSDQELEKIGGVAKAVYSKPETQPTFEELEIYPTVIETDNESDYETYAEQVITGMEPAQSEGSFREDVYPESIDGDYSDAPSIFSSSSQGFDSYVASLPQPPRTDNAGLRALLHPSSYTDLRATHLNDISLYQRWHLRKSRLLAQNPHAIHLEPPPLKQVKYRRPNRKIPKSLAKPAGKLWRHLGLYDPESNAARKLLRWLRHEDELLLSQVSLVAPRMQFQHIQEVHEYAFQPLRLQLLEHLRQNYENSTWCLFFSEFVYANQRHQLGDNDTTVNGSCLFLMVSTEETENIKKVAEGMLKKLRFGDELAVFVRNGNPKLFGSYGLPGGRGEYDGEDEFERGVKGKKVDVKSSTPKSGVRIGWPGFLSRRLEAAATTTTPPITPQKVSSKSKGDNATKGKPYASPPAPHSSSSGIASWDPSLTPSPHSPVKHIRSIHWDKPVFWRDLDAFTYGLRWVTKLAIPSAEEGENSKYYERPNIGSSLGAKRDSGSGTLAGYMSNNKGEVYAMTCHHVLYLVDAESVWPMSSDSIVNRSACQPISPSATDLRNTTKSTAHQIDGLMHEAVCAYTKGNRSLAERLTKEGVEKISEHDKLTEQLGKGGASFGGIVASAWKIAGMKGGPYMMDQVVLKPRIDRIGTNTFTYTGRDNKGGRRYRLEARGWTHLPLGAEVLKVGRTTSLTKGTVIGLDADIRILVGEDKQQHPTVHRVQRFWEVKCGIITGGTGPWFSEPGDSGSWILANPSFEDMLKWDLRRTGGKAMADPIPAPVGGMLFGGADSVDGINLTFYNPTKVVRRFLVEMLGPKLGRELKPGFGREIIPTPLSTEWEEQDAWSRQSQFAADSWASFVDSGFWGYQTERYSDNHLFRTKKWWDVWDRKIKEAGCDPGLRVDKGNKYDTAAKPKGKVKIKMTAPTRNNTPVSEEEETKPRLEEGLETELEPPTKSPSKPKLKFAPTTPRRKGSAEGFSNTPISTLLKTRRVGLPYVSVEKSMKEMTPGIYTPRSSSNTKKPSPDKLSTSSESKSSHSVKHKVRRMVARVEAQDGNGSEDELGKALMDSWS
ncbi:hypothetical protein TWF730_010930 [Orbilia blumenaviensis]|uniref:Uncharacterized protein n=1 Tax=Orbilia blumenaviensis TaxID=1796055 RepID=A0AAV9UJS8_9PEZI